MNATKKLTAVFAVLAVATVSYAGGKAASKEVSLKAADLKWNPMIPNMPDGPQVAGLWGDPAKGANGFLLKLPPGFNSGWHTHSNDYRAVVLKGVMSNASADDKTPVDLPQGSFYSTPGKLAHSNTCLAGSECLVYIHYEKKQDYQPAAEPKG